MNGSRANIYYKSINEKPRCTSSGICFKNIPRNNFFIFLLDLGNLFFEFSVLKVSFVRSDIRIHVITSTQAELTYNAHRASWRGTHPI